MQAGFDMDLYLDWRRDGHPNGYNLCCAIPTRLWSTKRFQLFQRRFRCLNRLILTEYLPDELSSDADVLLSLGEPAVSGGQLTLSPQSFVVFG